MQYRELGASGIKASVVGLGAWAIGGWMWGGTEENESIAALHAGIDAGMNLIDTAPIYGFGRSEEIVGKAIRDRRDKVVLATKCGLIWHMERGDHNFDSDESHPGRGDKYRVYRYLGPESIRYEIEKSLKRLGSDFIDLYQTHWQERTTPIEDTMAELLDLKDEGKIRAIGCSNADSEQMSRYLASGQLDSDQEIYSMLDRGHESDNLPYCREHGMAFLAYSPLAQGLLTGKTGPEREFKEGDQRKGKKRFSIENRRRVEAMLERFQPLTEKHKCSISRLVIAWTFHQPGCSHVLAGARNPGQALENAGAGDIRLSSEDCRLMRDEVESLNLEE